MRLALDAILGSFLCVAVASIACAQAAVPPAPPASAPVPMTAASGVNLTRNAAAMAAENAKEPGVQRPDERVTPQISLPLRNRNTTAATTASAPAGNVPGTVNDGTARCLAAGSASDKAACQRAAKASGQ